MEDITNPEGIKLHWEELQAQLDTFSYKLTESIDSLGIREQITGLAIDHACVRLATAEQVDALLDDLMDKGEVISCKVIHGRPIPILKLHQPVEVMDKSVDLLEVPYPKASQSYDDGWEHVEFILDNVDTNSPEGVEAAFFEKFPTLKEAGKQHLVDTYGYRMDIPTSNNATICIEVNGIGLKFHALSIQEVVGYTQ